MTRSILKKFKGRYGAHANVVVTSIRTDVPKGKHEKQFRKVMDDVKRQSKSKIGRSKRSPWRLCGDECIEDSKSDNLETTIRKQGDSLAMY